MEFLIFFLIVWPIIVFVVGYLLVRRGIVWFIKQETDKCYRLCSDYVRTAFNTHQAVLVASNQFREAKALREERRREEERRRATRRIPVTRIQIDIPDRPTGETVYYKSDPDGNPIRDIYNPDGRQYL